MKRKLTATILTAVMAVGVATPAFAAETANPTSSAIYVDGQKIDFEAYNINGNNYFKLRDVAWALSGTDTQFNVTWNDAEGVINLLSGEDYGKNGALSVGNGKVKSATLNTAPIMKDGSYVNMTAYNIEGNNFFKLRDLGEQFGFNVGWNGTANAVTIDTDGVADTISEAQEEQQAGAITIKEGQQSSRPAKAGDTIVKADGTKVVLKVGPNGVLGEGQGVAPDANLSVAKATSASSNFNKNGVFTYDRTKLGVLTDSLGKDLMNQKYMVNATTGEGHWRNEWNAIRENYPAPQANGTYEGQVSSDPYSLYVWDGMVGWIFNGK